MVRVRLPGRVNVGVQSVGRADTRLPARVAAAQAGAANEFAAAMGTIAGGLEDFERRESEAQYAEAITKFERDELALRQDLGSSRKYTQEQLSDWGVQSNPAWRSDPETGEVEASESMSEIYQQLVQRAYDEAFSGITAPTAKEQFGRTVPRAIVRTRGDVIAQQRKLYLDTFAARQISAAEQHLQNGNAELAIASYESARDAGALTAKQAQNYIDSAPAQAEMHSVNRVLRSQDSGSMRGLSAALTSDGYKGELDEESRYRAARTLRANADALDNEARKERYQSEVERVRQADAGELQALMTKYKQPGAPDRLGLDPTQLATLFSSANTKLVNEERRMLARSEAAVSEIIHQEGIDLSRGVGIDEGTLERIDASYESGRYGPPGTPTAMRARTHLNNMALRGMKVYVEQKVLQTSAENHDRYDLAFATNDPKRNEKADIVLGTYSDSGMTANEATVRVASKLNALPKTTQTMFKSVAFSPGHPQVENAALLFDQIRRAGGAQALKEDLSEDEFDRLSYLADTTAAGIPVANAFDTLDRIAQQTDKQRADALATWREMQKDSDTSTEEYIEDQQPGFFARLFGVDQPELAGRALEQTKARAEMLYLAYGDAAFANKQAYEWFSRRYGVSELNGVPEFTFHPVETTYGRNADGTPVMSSEEARRQLIEDLSAEGYKADSLVRIEASSVSGPDGKPVYAVWVEDPETGVLEVLPNPWQPDPSRRVEYLQEKREEFFRLEREGEQILEEIEGDPRSTLERLRRLESYDRIQPPASRPGKEPVSLGSRG